MRFVKFTLIGLVSITLAFLSLGFFHQSFEFQNEIEIQVSPDIAFAFFTDEDQKSKWLSGFYDSETISGKALKKGHRKVLKFKQEEQPYEMVEELREILADEKIVFQVETDLFVRVNEIYFMGKDDQTLIKSSSSIEGSTFLYRAMFYLLKNSIKQQTQLQYEALKQAIEHKEN